MFIGNRRLRMLTPSGLICSCDGWTHCYLLEREAVKIARAELSWIVSRTAGR